MSHLQAHSKASEESLAPQASHQPPKAASVRVICNETFLDIFKHCDFCIAIQISILPPDIIDQFKSWTFKSSPIDFISILENT